ncbi:MAG: indolepyruvate oxidoreductase subunit beta [Deltaproteobacteria bacterium]|nr:indolepyruvate oxidoreductase subunit beta [Deltaproteobacteria bacterium]
MAFQKDPFNVIIGGVGGQGNVIASQVLGRILLKKGYVITIGETYGASQRGGAVMSHLRISAKDQFSPLIPEGQCDLLMALEPVEGLRILGQYGNPAVISLVNTRPIHPIEIISGQTPYPDVQEVLRRIGELSKEVWALNATEIALEMGDPIFSNMIMLGALSTFEMLEIDHHGFEQAIGGLLSSERLSENLEAFERGRMAVKKR